MMNARRKLRSLVLTAAVGLVLIPLAGQNAWAHRPIEYRWLAASGLTLFGPVCDVGALINDLCPDKAESTKDLSTLEISGEGRFQVISSRPGDGFRPQKITGGGSFAVRRLGGDVLIGTWTAKKLLSFESFGPSPCTFAAPCFLGLPAPLDPLGLPESWEAGVAWIKIQLKVDATGERFHGILGVFCNLPLVVVPEGHFEGIRAHVDGIGTFDRSLADDPGGRVTLFKRVR